MPASTASASVSHSQADREPSGVDRVKAVDILVGRYTGDDDLLVDLRRERQLDEDSVDCGIGIEPVDQRNEIVLRRIGGKPVLEAFHTRLERRLAL